MTVAAVGGLAEVTRREACCGLAERDACAVSDQGEFGWFACAHTHRPRSAELDDMHPLPKRSGAAKRTCLTRARTEGAYSPKLQPHTPLVILPVPSGRLPGAPDRSMQTL